MWSHPLGLVMQANWLFRFYTQSGMVLHERIAVEEVDVNIMGSEDGGVTATNDVDFICSGADLLPGGIFQRGK